MFQQGEVVCKKKTHSSRGSGARAMDMARVPMEQIARLGGWVHARGHIVSAYLTNIPVPAAMASAGFSHSAPLSQYYVPRLAAPVPAELRDLGREYIFYGADAALESIRAVSTTISCLCRYVHHMLACVH